MQSWKLFRSSSLSTYGCCRPKNVLRQKNTMRSNPLGSTKVLADGHTVTVINVKSTSSSTQNCSENLGDEGPTPPGEDNKERNCYHAHDRHVYQPILPWLNADGTINSTVYEGLSRRVIGYVMQYPGMVEEDVIRRLDVLNPQTCRTLLDKLTSEKHLSVRVLDEPLPTAPTILRSLFKQDPSQKPSKCKKRYFANPMSTFLL
ncbi:hypothetical protein EJB05_03132 [Eragrostis curvula]|uniref:Uncharacterized protein n=1 Tax=Eragrostis curvula TaxID=38414 RepID=A0A5J9WUF9_9POAL|nr:hypothetical protein EJB05_03132 [Eragrostis curvula]